MWSEALAFVTEGVINNAFEATAAPEDQQLAMAYLKLFFLFPRLLLSSSKGVAGRARLILTGKLDAFEKLYEESEPRAVVMQANGTQRNVQETINRRVVRSCDLSRAINSLVIPERVTITHEIIDKVHELHPIAQPEHRIPNSASTKVQLDPRER